MHKVAKRTKSVFDIVYTTLRNYPSTRSSDKALIWHIYRAYGFAFQGRISKFGFYYGPTFSSITRARRMVQEMFPEYRATREVRAARRAKELERGTFVFREGYRRS